MVGSVSTPHRATSLGLETACYISPSALPRRNRLCDDLTGLGPHVSGHLLMHLLAAGPGNLTRNRRHELPDPVSDPRQRGPFP